MIEVQLRDLQHSNYLLLLIQKVYENVRYLSSMIPNSHNELLKILKTPEADKESEKSKIPFVQHTTVSCDASNIFNF